MKTLNLKVAWTFYIIGMLICLSMIFDRNHITLKLLIGTLFLLVSWIAIFIELIKNPVKNKGLFIYLLIFFGGVFIPYYLITRKDRVNQIK
jgi:hypothetical protein